MAQFGTIEKDDLFIVGIGASAGGLEAIRTLLKSSPQDAPAAYVVIQHMSPTQRSLLSTLVARETHLETEELSEDVVPLRNHVYVVPPGSDVIYHDGKLKLVPHKDDLVSPKPSVDRFFRSVAEGAPERAIGIVLSGTGSDGSAGVKAIREAGGITFAQDGESAKYDGMPNSAVETGCIDLILSPLDIGQRLETLSLTVPHLAEAMKSNDEQAPLMDILQIVLAKTRVDFRDYKPTTILRRLERRMIAVGMGSHAEYADYLRKHDEEVEELFRDFLISVTRFFRDPEHYESLKPTIKKMIEDKRGKPIRIWIAGCATGEEAYSIAMMVCEALGGLEEAKKGSVRIFATDIDARALETARSGRYSRGALTDVPEEFIAPYFEIEDDFATIVPDLKQMILFSMHNVAQDPPFMNIDLICCRNLLIYFNPVLQDRTLSNFHYALNDDGKVFLGTAETATVSEDLFAELELGRKVLRKRPNKNIRYEKRAQRVRYITPTPRPVQSQDPSEKTPAATVDHSVNAMVTALAHSLGEAAILLTQDLLMVHVFGDVSPYISLPSGQVQSEMDHNLLVEPLAAEIRVLSTMVSDQKRSVRGYKRKLPSLGGDAVRMEMLLLKGPDIPGELYLVAFNRIDAASASEGDGEDTEDASENHALRDELTTTRDALNQTIERWETMNEELKSSNEEMQSNNEELQSMNEELETSNEELQSTNEELITINEAYQVQSAELNELNKELEAVLDQVEAPMLIYDLKLRLTKYSQTAAELFEIKPGGGQPHLSQIALPKGFPLLVPLCDNALRLGQSVTEDFESDGRAVRINCAPFTDTRNAIQGGIMFVTSWGEQDNA